MKHIPLYSIIFEFTDYAPIIPKQYIDDKKDVCLRALYSYYRYSRKTAMSLFGPNLVLRPFPWQGVSVVASLCSGGKE